MYEKINFVQHDSHTSVTKLKSSRTVQPGPGYSIGRKFVQHHFISLQTTNSLYNSVSGIDLIINSIVLSEFYRFSPLSCRLERYCRSPRGRLLERTLVCHRLLLGPYHACASVWQVFVNVCRTHQALTKLHLVPPAPGPNVFEDGSETRHIHVYYN